MNSNLIEWPFRNRAFFCWSDVYPDYAKRMSAIADDYLHWSLLL